MTHTPCGWHLIFTLADDRTVTNTHYWVEREAYDASVEEQDRVVARYRSEIAMIEVVPCPEISRPARQRT